MINLTVSARFRASKLFCYQGTVRIIVPEIGPKSFGAFERRTTGPQMRDVCEPRARAISRLV